MILSSRVNETKASVTLKVNENINKLAQNGRHIYNLTSGQLPFKPAPDFIAELRKQLNFLKSYQYSPIPGFSKLREKFLKHTEKKRNISFDDIDREFDCVISNGTKHTIYNVLGALVNPGDEVIILTPYWVSYPEMVKFWGGKPVAVNSHSFDAYTPQIEEIEKAITDKTKVLILNSPNNPAGIHYPDTWMKDFAKFLKKYPDLVVISDELYAEICYFDPAPTYFYQHDNSLLKQTVIVNGISKSLACTGLRVGYCIADAELTKAMAKIQSQTTSGPNSLIQNALIDFDFDSLENYFDPVLEQLRGCAQLIRSTFRDANLPHCYYQTNSAFYYILDFSRMPIYDRFKTENSDDVSKEIVESILEETSVALVPGSAFGYPNSARMSITLEIGPFEEAINRLVSYLVKK